MTHALQAARRRLKRCSRQVEDGQVGEAVRQEIIHEDGCTTPDIDDGRIGGHASL